MELPSPYVIPAFAEMTRVFYKLHISTCPSAEGIGAALVQVIRRSGKLAERSQSERNVLALEDPTEDGVATESVAERQLCASHERVQSSSQGFGGFRKSPGPSIKKPFLALRQKIVGPPAPLVAVLAQGFVILPEASDQGFHGSSSASTARTRVKSEGCGLGSGGAVASDMIGSWRAKVIGSLIRLSDRLADPVLGAF